MECRRISAYLAAAADTANSFAKGRERVRGDMPMQHCATINGNAVSYERPWLTCTADITPLFRDGKNAPRGFVISGCAREMPRIAQYLKG